MKLLLTARQCFHPLADVALKYFRNGKPREAFAVIRQIDRDHEKSAAEKAADEAYRMDRLLEDTGSNSRDRGLIRERFHDHPIHKKPCPGYKLPRGTGLFGLNKKRRNELLGGNDVAV